MNQNIELVLQHSAALHTELDDLWGSFLLPSSDRGRVVAGYCSIVREHVLSQQRLLTFGFDVTAVTLVRPSFESLVRAIWSLKGASEEWIREFLTPPAPEVDARDETIKGPPVDSMLAVIAKHHPQWVHQSLSALKDETWKPMHSYVHGGIRPVLHVLLGCPDPQRVSLVLNGNGFFILATNVLQMACGGAPGRIAEIQRRFARCLPPQSSAGST
ncbi:DUF6988 family protein [Lysobacter solisilvae (ex Woo and Kim 2020)]|uniref:Uncharacterized protein n=1 Tax=Agrilutibacter terrestris TaxID=2865112 RepID=A0A7H0G002_9GAMM|nr:hypothetical protein [Lysobacter terrestris]QNP41618.1 hypothetical protein H8B22_05270 [Lysobacter terrestris]